MGVMLKIIQREIMNFVKNNLIEGLFCFLLLSIVTIGEAMTLEEIKEITNGKGVFTLAITNDGDTACSVDVSIYIRNPPPNPVYKHMQAVYLGSLYVKSHETATMELPVPYYIAPPFRGLQTLDDIRQYDNTDGLVPLPENCEIVIMVEDRVSKLDLYYPILLHGQYSYDKSFKAHYLSGTRLLELPAEIPIAVNFDRDEEREKMRADSARMMDFSNVKPLVFKAPK